MPVGRFLIEWALIGALGAGAIVLTVAGGVTERASFPIYDLLLQHHSQPPSSNVVIVAIDDASIAALGRWPWPRTIHAALLQRLAAARPRGVAYDVLFTEASPADAEFARAMHQVPTFLPLLIDREPVNLQDVTALQPVAPLRAAAAGIGHIDLDVDRDGIVRSTSLREASGGTQWPSLMVQVYRALRGAQAPLPGTTFEASDERQTIRHANRMLIPFSDASLNYPQVSFAAVLQGTVPPEVFAGKVVLVGSTATGLRDRFATPMSGEAVAQGELPGVSINATILDALLDGHAIEPASHAAAVWAGLLPVAILLAGLLATSPLQSLVLTAVLAMASFVGSAALLYLGNRWLSPVPAIGALVLIYLLWSWRRLEVAISYLGQELRLLAAEPYLLPSGAADHGAGAGPRGDRLERLIALTRQAVQRQRDLRQFIWDSLNSLPEPIVVCDPRGTVLIVNDPARRFFGAQRFAGATLMQLLDGFRFVRLVDAENSAALPNGVTWPAVLDPCTSAHTDVMTRGIEVRDGHERDHMLRYARCATGAGAPIGWIASWVDVTALHAAERQRDDMLHLLSHDMRSPQASILALLETEKTRATPRHALEWLDRIERYARRTLALADDVVQLARAESQHYHVEPLNLVELAIDACDEIWPLAQAKQIEVRCENGDAACWVVAERSLLTRALVNLLSNAVKFSPCGAVIDCRVSAADDTVSVLVRDRGYGIALEQQPYLFERFRRFRVQHQPPVDGTGLGMAFVKTVVNRHGGRVTVDSAPDRGTSVTIDLPAQPV